MKREIGILALMVALALLTALIGGCAPVGTQGETPPPDISESAELSPSNEARPAPCLNLSYNGLQTNPHNLTRSYDVISDSDFVAVVWEKLNYDSWTQRREGSVAMVSISLLFYDPESLELAIDPNDVGWIIEDTGDPYTKKYTYFDIPAGTYEEIENLLTDYSAEHFMPEISLELLDVSTESDHPLSIDLGSDYFVLSPQQAGEFTEDWQLGAWEESRFGPQKTNVFIRGVYSKSGLGPVYIAIDAEAQFASITLEGESKLYKIPQETAQLIIQQFESFRLVGQTG